MHRSNFMARVAAALMMGAGTGVVMRDNYPTTLTPRVGQRKLPRNRKTVTAAQQKRAATKRRNKR